MPDVAPGLGRFELGVRERQLPPSNLPNSGYSAFRTEKAGTAAPALHGAWELRRRDEAGGAGGLRDFVAALGFNLFHDAVNMVFYGKL